MQKPVQRRVDSIQRDAGPSRDPPRVGPERPQTGEAQDRFRILCHAGFDDNIRPEPEPPAEKLHHPGREISAVAENL